MKKIFPLLVGLFLIFEIFVLNGKISLWDQDEAAYASFAKEMIETGNYAVPHYTWSKIHRKPPLHFWLIALSYKIFGINEFSVRFSVALAVLGTFLLMYYYGKKLWNETTAILSVLVLASSLFVPLLGKIALTDGLLLFFYTLTAFSFIMVLEKKSKIHIFWFWFAISLGLLVKGPPIAIFAGFLFIIGLIFSKKRKNIISLHPWFYGWISILPLLIWGYFAWKYDNGKFIHWLIDWYVLKRVNSAVLGQTGPVGYYLATFIIFFIPYLVFLPSGFVNAFKSLKNKDNNPYFLPFVWLVSGWLFYEFLKSKLPSYVLAAHPAIAIIIALEIENFLNTKKLNTLQIISLLFQILISWVLFAAVLYLRKKINTDLTQIILIFLLFASANLFVLILYWGKLYQRFISYLIMNGLLFAILNFTITLNTIEKFKNATKQVALYIKENTQKNTLVIIQNSQGKPPSLPFYIETVANRKYKIVSNIDSLTNIFENEKNVIFITDKKTKDILFDKFCNVSFKEISSFSTDRKIKKDYFIIKKY